MNKKWLIILLSNILLLSLTYYLFVHLLIRSAIIIPLFIPLIWIISYGIFKNRIRYSLPILGIMLYLALGFIFRLWDEALIIFFILPYISLILKPRRHPLQYASITITSVYLILSFIFGYDIYIVFRLFLLLIIYALFLPLVLEKLIRKRFKQNA